MKDMVITPEQHKNSLVLISCVLGFICGLLAWVISPRLGFPVSVIATIIIFSLMCASEARNSRKYQE